MIFYCCDLEKPLAFAQVANLHGTMIVLGNEASQTVRNTFPTFFSQACPKMLDWTIAISLLVRQQLELDQILT